MRHVGRDPGNAAQTRVVAEILIQFLQRHARLAQEVNNRTGIHGTGARPHDQTVQGTEADGAPDGPAVLHGCRGTASAQMTIDQSEGIGRSVQDFRSSLCAVGVADSVKSEPANTESFEILGRQGIEIGLGGKPGEKGGIENGDLRNPAEQLLGTFNRTESGWVVQRSQLRQPCNRRFHFRCDTGAVAKLRSPVNHPVSCGNDTNGALSVWNSEIKHGIQGAAHGASVIWN
ncbi:hypothetical protein SDC9_173167 [bioreactor metagenome]|uniref:Uncharacterized protein n=1 Tax=bioreactor metagenome TaxID=1076179 RepID=A0A645GIF2_9ZZZZ